MAVVKRLNHLGRKSPRCFISSRGFSPPAKSKIWPVAGQKAKARAWLMLCGCCWKNSNHRERYDLMKSFPMEGFPCNRKHGNPSIGKETGHWEGFASPIKHYFKIMFCGCWKGTSNHKTKISSSISPQEGVHEMSSLLWRRRGKRKSRPEPKPALI